MSLVLWPLKLCPQCCPPTANIYPLNNCGFVRTWWNANNRGIILVRYFSGLQKEKNMKSRSKSGFVTDCICKHACKGLIYLLFWTICFYPEMWQQQACAQIFLAFPTLNDINSVKLYTTNEFLHFSSEDTNAQTLTNLEHQDSLSYGGENSFIHIGHFFSYKCRLWYSNLFWCPC